MNVVLNSRIGCCCLLLGSLLAWNAQAAVVPGAKHEAKAGVMEALHSAHKLLAEANHDYKGHRVLAMHDLHQAIHELGGAPATASGHAAANAHAPGNAHAAGGAMAHGAGHEGRVHEQQSKSDAQLREAQQVLQHALGSMKTHHPAAAKHIEAAIAQITTALSIR